MCFLEKNVKILPRGKIVKITKTEELGELIKSTRKAQGLTQADLAAAVNTGIRFIVDIENGKETAQIGKVLNVCRALGITLNFDNKEE